MTTAVELKNSGNAALAAGDPVKAIKLYTEAIELDDTSAVIYANRALAATKVEQFGKAIRDAERAIELDPSYIKALYRRAAAHAGLLDYRAAIADYSEVVKRVPGDKAAAEKLAEARKLLRAQQFMRAIEVEDEPSVFEKLDLNSMPNDDGLPEEINMAFVEALVANFKANKRVSRRKLFRIIKEAADLFAAEPTMNELAVPAKDAQVTVVGDTHGQFYDFLHIFELAGWPSEQHKFVFNGDFVDRGSWSTEIALTLYSLKIAQPNAIFINRGNHETDSMNVAYGFSGECQAKYQTQLAFKAFSESFNKLPLAALIGNAYFVVHGGLFSDKKVSLEDVRKLDRFKYKQPPQQGIFMEMLWTDPQDQNGQAPSDRGIGMQFGPDITRAFTDANNLKAVIRSHQVREEGYSVEHDGRLVTVFSAPNYCDSTGNKAALVHIGQDLEMKFQQFEAVPHPSVPAMAYASKLLG